MLDIGKTLVISASHVKIKTMETKDNKYNFEVRRSESFRRHRRQSFWQIWVPLIIFTLVILGAAVLMVLTITGKNTGINLSQYGDTSLIWIFVPLILIALIIAAALVGLLIINGKILKHLPRYTHPVQKIFSQVSGKVESISKKMMTPIISIRSIGAGVDKALSSLLGRNKK